MTKFVLSGYFGFKNFGDEAILAVLVEKLRTISGSKITVISSDPLYTKALYKDVKSIYTFSITDIITEIMSSDVVISGGGSLLQDTTSFKSLIYYLLIIFLGLLAHKKVIIFAQGIGPIKNIFGLFLTMQILRHCSYVSVRDKKSHALLRAWGIKSDLLCDPIFSTNIESYAKDNDTVIVQLRDCKNISNDFIDRLAQSVCDNFAGKKLEILSFQDSYDLDVCKKFEKIVNILEPSIQTKVFSNLTNREITEKISKAQYLVAMRFHAIIIGLLSKTKTLAINYDIKVEKLAKEFKIPVIDLKKPFNKEFEDLINQNTEKISKITELKTFDWKGFDSIINSKSEGI